MPIILKYCDFENVTLFRYSNSGFLSSSVLTFMLIVVSDLVLIMLSFLHLQSQRRRKRNQAELLPLRTEPDKPPPIDYFRVEAVWRTPCLACSPALLYVASPSYLIQV